MRAFCIQAFSTESARGHGPPRDIPAPKTYRLTPETPHSSLQTPPFLYLSLACPHGGRARGPTPGSSPIRYSSSDAHISTLGAAGGGVGCPGTPSSRMDLTAMRTNRQTDRHHSIRVLGLLSWHLGVIGSLVHAALSAKARVLKGAVRAEQVAQRPYPCLEHLTLVPVRTLLMRNSMLGC